MGIRKALGLKREFANGTTPDPKEFQGRYAVRLVTGLLPDIRFFSHTKVFPEGVDEKGGGCNEFLGWFRLGDFKVESMESILGDGQKIARINYNRPGNPFVLKALNDELKKTGEGRYLGRGVFSVFGRAFNTFYFSLEKI